MDNVRDFVLGTCDGTGAAINVCLGFIPSLVEVLNVDSATYEKIEWDNQMALVSAIDEGLVVTGTGTFTRAAVATNGISEYSGGDELIYDKDVSAAWEDSAGTSKEEVYVDGNYRKSAAGSTAYKCIGDAIEPDPQHGQKIKTTPGFTIGADANLNVNGEQLVWRVWR